jgi:hypothetical protein
MSYVIFCISFSLIYKDSDVGNVLLIQNIQYNSLLGCCRSEISVTTSVVTGDSGVLVQKSQVSLYRIVPCPGTG